MVLCLALWTKPCKIKPSKYKTLKFKLWIILISTIADYLAFLNSEKRMIETHFKMVQEKVDSSKPKYPQTSINGGTSIPKLKAHTKKIIRKMLVLE